MADLEGVNIGAVYGFMERMKTACREESPALKTEWKIIGKSTRTKGGVGQAQTIDSIYL